MRWQDARATAQCGHEAYPRFVACHMALQISAISAGTDPVERRERERHIVYVCERFFKAKFQISELTG